MSLATNEPYLFDGQFATGALWRPPDKRNYDMRWLPGVQEQLRIGYPDTDEHLKEHVVHTYSQGSTPACVAHTIAGVMTTNQHIERRGERMIFDAMGLHEETGPMNQGRWPGDLLKVAQDKGVSLVATGKRYRVGSYAFAPTTSAQVWVDTMKAAIAAGHVCGLAMRLPSSFGWESGGSLLGWETYHEVMVCAYRPNAFLIKNSWGNGWGREGFGWVPIEFLIQQRFQDGAIIGNTIIDGIDDDLPPLPPQPDPPTPNPPTPNPTPQPNDFAREVIRLVNQHRTGMGLKALAEHPGLMKSADAKSEDMGRKGYFAHEHEGKGPLAWMQEAGVQNPVVWGENIAAGQIGPSYRQDQAKGWDVSAWHSYEFRGPAHNVGHALRENPSGAFTDWLNSPGHRANIEFPGFTHIGVGYRQISPSQYGTYWTQHFIGTGLGPHPEPEPDPGPDPMPPPERVIVTAKAGGFGLEFLQRGQVLDAQGGGFQGTLAISNVQRDGEPQPEPEPDPLPTPDPEPLPPDPSGDLQVSYLLAGARGGWNLFVYVTDPLGTVGQAAVTISGSAGVTVRQVLRTASLDGRRPATASVKGPAMGTLTIEATAGSRTGRTTAVLSGAGSGELPPLLEELE